MKVYDLIVVGSGPAGEKAAIKAADNGKKVALIEKRLSYGGAAAHGGLPAKVLKDTAYRLSKKVEHDLYGKDPRASITLEKFLYRAHQLSDLASANVKTVLAYHQVDCYHGTATFSEKDSHQLRILGDKEEVITGDYILLAPGCYVARPEQITFDGKRIHDVDTILRMPYFPRSLCVIGMGIIGFEYASIFSAMQKKVFFINNVSSFLEQVDHEVASFVLERLKERRVEFLFNCSVVSVYKPRSRKELLDITLNTGEILHVDMLLYAANRKGNIRQLNLDRVGIQYDPYKEWILVDHTTYQTNIPHIYAVGDVLGPPGLANIAMDQGRIAVSHMFGFLDSSHLSSLVSYGIYSQPEIGALGLTEEQAKEQNVAYGKGYAFYEQIPRGNILDAKGFLKILFDKHSLKILGIHIVGVLASEIIHYGVGLIETQKTIRDVAFSAPNFPTLHQLYKDAALHALKKLSTNN